MGPLLNPSEMANKDVAAAAARLAAAPYAASFAQLFGAEVMRMPQRLVDEAMFAIARYQVEDPSFHPYTSKYDYWLEGKAVLSAAESRGLAMFEDKSRGNCAACHLDRPGPDGMPPMFTDYQYEALAVPRNDSLEANRDPAFHDLGVCGPVRTDLSAQTQYCAMFRTPSLRNVALRAVFFHNGRYRSLDSVLAFYNLRDVRPSAIYGTGEPYDDVPAAFQRNIDRSDPPFNRARGAKPPMTEREMQDIVAFLRTLTDGQ
jgi:cytochrome c peroxidase